MTNNKIAPASLVIAAIAIIIAIASVANTPDLSKDFATHDQARALTERVLELEARESCHDDTECLDYMIRNFQLSSITMDLLEIVTNQGETLGKHQEQIVKNTEEINNNHPYQIIPEEVPVESEVQQFSSLLEIHLDKENWTRGDTIIFAGNALVDGGQVSALITEPSGNERYVNAIVHKDGTYNFVFGTDFESELGEYSISVSQRTRVSQTVTFTLGE